MYKKEFREFRKMFVKISFLFLFVCAVVYVIFLFLKYEQFQESLEAQAKVKLTKKVSYIKSHLSNVKESISTIEEVSIKMASDTKEGKELLKDIARHFKVFMEHNENYRQLRVLDLEGREIVRVEKGADGAYGSAVLQDKSDRYYYQKATDLLEGEIYVSPLDLNMEAGRIAIPRDPVIRFVKPVVIEGEKFGYLVLNYGMKKFLDDFKKLDYNIKDLLLNKDGFYLSGFQEQDEFGFMFDNDKANFAYSFEDVWAKISSHETGKVKFAENIGVYEKYNPVETVSPHRSVNTSVEWVLLVYFEKELIYQKLLGEMRNNQIFLIVVFPLVLVLAYAFAYLIVSIQRSKRQLMQQSKMAQMGEMLSMIAHQWRQPLASISAIVSTLQMKIMLRDDDLSKEEGRDEYMGLFSERLETINGLVQNLTTTINDFKNFYRPDNKAVSMALEEIVLKSLNIIKTSLLDDGVELIEAYGSQEKIRLYDNEMTHVLLNIIQNAQDNFKINQTKDPYIKIMTENNTVSICDNGGGIAEENLEKIFEPYFSTKDNLNGTGLGLYMSKEIVEKHHHGSLSVENIEDAQGRTGACFTIELGLVNE